MKLPCVQGKPMMSSKRRRRVLRRRVLTRQLSDEKRLALARIKQVAEAAAAKALTRVVLDNVRLDSPEVANLIETYCDVSSSETPDKQQAEDAPGWRWWWS